MLPKYFMEQSEVDGEIRRRTWEELQKEARDKKLILFGSGKGALRFMTEYAGKWNLKPAYILDNSAERRGGVFCGLPVCAPDQLSGEKPEQTVIVIASVYVRSISRQLQQMGYGNVFSFLYLRYVDRKIKPQEQETVKRLREMLADDKSKQVLDRVVLHRNRNDWDYRDCYEPLQYFAEGLMIPRENEVFVDAGAYNGDTVEAFLKWCGNRFQSIWAYEPDEGNYRKLTEKYCGEERIHCVQACLWSEDTQLNFESNHDSTSIITECGSGWVPAKKLEVPERVTLIKMDIEGAEMEALEGAREIILRDRPDLAVCIYHKHEDLWKIPFWIHEICPDYRLYIRHHCMQWHETVVYAITDRKDGT